MDDWYAQIPTLFPTLPRRELTAFDLLMVAIAIGLVGLLLSFSFCQQSPNKSPQDEDCDNDDLLTESNDKDPEIERLIDMRVHEPFAAILSRLDTIDLQVKRLIRRSRSRIKNAMRQTESLE